MEAATIAIPTAGRLLYVERLLRDLAEVVDYRAPLEVLVVDDALSADLRRMVHERACGLPPSLPRATGPPGVNAARNTALADTQGDLIVFLDDDCRPSAGFAGICPSPGVDAAPEARRSAVR